MFLQIGVTGIISFDQPVYTGVTTPFPGHTNKIHNIFLVAPFWDEIDIRRSGNVFYEVHDTFTDDDASEDLISQVSEYIEGETGEAFFGEWMLVVQWDKVHPWPHGDDPLDLNDKFRNSDYTEVSSAFTV